MIDLLATLAFTISVTNPYPDEYICINPESMIVDSALVEAELQIACEELAKLRPDERFMTLSAKHIVATPVPPPPPPPPVVPDPEPRTEEWIVNDPLIGAKEELVECLNCEPNSTKRRRLGDRIGRTYPAFYGRCEGPMDPIWGNNKRQWQYHTGPDGTRGMTRCVWRKPYGDDPAIPPDPMDETMSLPVTDRAHCDYDRDDQVLVTWEVEGIEDGVIYQLFAGNTQDTEEIYIEVDPRTEIGVCLRELDQSPYFVRLRAARGSVTSDYSVIVKFLP